MTYQMFLCWAEAWVCFVRNENDGRRFGKSSRQPDETVVEILTTNRFMGILVGILVTAIIQSSSATTVMVVGFVNTGLIIWLRQPG